MRGFRIYNRVLTPEELIHIYHYERVDFLTWWQKLIYYAKETWLLLVGSY